MKSKFDKNGLFHSKKMTKKKSFKKSKKIFCHFVNFLYLCSTLLTGSLFLAMTHGTQNSYGGGKMLIINLLTLRNSPLPHP